MELLEILHGPFSRNVKQVRPVQEGWLENTEETLRLVVCSRWRECLAPEVVNDQFEEGFVVIVLQSLSSWIARMVFHPCER